jgi:hypothetical protein
MILCKCGRAFPNMEAFADHLAATYFTGSKKSLDTHTLIYDDNPSPANSQYGLELSSRLVSNFISVLNIPKIDEIK